MAGRLDILKTWQLTQQHPCYAALRDYAQVTGVSVDKSPSLISFGTFQFLIWGGTGPSDLCVYYSERDIEVGQAIRSWATVYGQTGSKPETSQYGGS
jgi:hypothetical protein